MKIYGSPSCEILSPISSSKEDVKKGGFVEVTNSEVQNLIITGLQELEIVDNYDPGDYGIDNKFLVVIQCKNSTIIEIESNCSITTYDKKYFDPTDEFVQLIEKAIKNSVDN